ncbi:unnamed protein product [Durusdinium trenchii]|uniref:RING-type domain-containing protein n=1 Tax=Durusdinium trenchii TaxID=1381693 RepID=A0ABP0HWH7_9DINO
MFRQQLAHKTGESKAAYNVKTEQLVNNFVQAEMQEFMQQCNQAAENRRNHCKWTINDHFFCNRDGGQELVLQKFKEQMAELGFPNGVGQPYYHNSNFHVDLTATWEAEDTAACTVEEAAPGGTRITCPICHEHRPGVALIPCGHVICRDCHRCQQIRQCPMCREATFSATRGLFMD